MRERVAAFALNQWKEKLELSIYIRILHASDFILAKRRAETRELLVTHAGSLARFVQKVNDLCSLY
jgi:hypothetical protein